MSIWFVKKLVKILISFRRSYLLRSINLINPFTSSSIRKLFTNYCNPPPSKKKKIIIKTKGELNLKTIDPLSSQSKQIPLFSTKNRRSTIREQNSGRVYSSSHSHPLSPGQLLAPDLLRFQVEKAGGRSSREGRSWGDKRFVLVRPRSKWLFRGQESPRELKIRAIGHEGEGLAG